MNVSAKRNVLFKKYIAEAIGTFVLVFFGCGSAVIGNHKGDLGYGGISFAFGLCVIAMAYTFGNISGCHLNPAVTLAMYVVKSVDLWTGFFYIISQCIGATLGSAALLGIAQGMPGYKLEDDGLGQNGYGEHSPQGYSAASCFFSEWLLTLIFILVILGSTSEKSGHSEQAVSGLVIGLTLCLIHLVGIPMTGVSVNPARSLGPAIILLTVDTSWFVQLWLFWTAPFLASFTAAWLWKFFFDEEWQKRHGLTELANGQLDLDRLKKGRHAGEGVNELVKKKEEEVTIE